MGLNSKGLFVGLTNRASAAPRADRRSRGLLVRDALQCGSARQVADTLGRGLEGRYNPFHLVYSDGRDAFLTHLGEDEAETARLEPGIHVVCNRGEEDPMTGKAGAIRRALGALDVERPFSRVYGDLVRVLASHEHSPQPLENPCVHTPGYGTRSAAIIASGGDEAGFWFAPGPPCESKFEDFTDLLSAAR